MIVIQANPITGTSVVITTIYLTGWELFKSNTAAQFPKSTLPTTGSFLLSLTSATTNHTVYYASGDLRGGQVFFTKRCIKFPVRASNTAITYSTSLGGGVDLSGPSTPPGMYPYEVRYQTDRTGNIDPKNTSAGVSNVIDEGVAFIKQESDAFALPTVTSYTPARTENTYTYYE